MENPRDRDHEAPVTPPRREDPSDERIVAAEEAAAAAEARGIGGPVDEDDLDPAQRPVIEAGGGEAEGFELAEADLAAHAEHSDDARDPTVDAFSPEVESDRASAVYAESDEIDPTEVVRDPREGPDDPGAGPHLAPDR